ncbi:MULTISPECIES: hypothetical protein [unclassified Novosphingobium]|uniref:hypothetical protein n=1 Tax=unclassified Novosphingobium TaxID=2644732 RepID=UPI0013C348F2|nr:MULTISPECIES: hypothetical protein [unclassified Novosphingobium]NLR41384.1 hypothetical protein [Novosphingobium sp. ERW19]
MSAIDLAKDLAKDLGCSGQAGFSLRYLAPSAAFERREFRPVHDPDDGLAAKTRFSEAIQRLASDQRWREAAHADFAP